MTDKPIEQMNQDELQQLQNEMESKLRDANDNYALVDQLDIALSRDIITLQLKRKENAILISKAKNNVKTIESTIREAKSRYWMLKNG